jgi:hypothetical protein
MSTKKVKMLFHDGEFRLLKEVAAMRGISIQALKRELNASPAAPAANPNVLGYMGVVIKNVIGGYWTLHRSVETSPEISQRAEEYKAVVPTEDLQSEFIKAILKKEWDDAMAAAVAMLQTFEDYKCFGFLARAEAIQHKYVSSTVDWLHADYDTPGKAQDVIRPDMLEIEKAVHVPQPAPLMFGVGKHGIVRL